MGGVGVLALITMLSPVAGEAFQAGSISGTVVDPLGARVSGTVVLYRNGQQAGQTSSGVDGSYSFSGLVSGRYQVEASAAGFASSLSDPVFVGSSGSVAVDLTVQVGPLEQQISVTAAATVLPVAQLGAPVSVLDSDFIEQLGKPDILEALRTVPGLSVVQTGARGGTTNVFTRGGEADFTKVLIDGAPANDIGGRFSFAALSTSGVESVEVLRTSNSVLYGADAMSGVISVETKRGRTRMPEFSYAVDGGNLGTTKNEVSIGQAIGRFDYFVDASRYDTNNDLPNNEYRNDTFASRVGFFLGSTTHISATYRRVETDLETPNGILYYGIPDDSSQRVRQTYATVTAVSDADPVTTTFRYSYTQRSSVFTNPTPTGEPFDPFGFGPNYLGDAVTIVGENGFSVTGRAILDFGGTYPGVFPSDSRRHLFSGQADVDVTDGFDFSFGARIEDEEGGTVKRRNHGYFIEGRGNLGLRFYVTGGLGVEDHEVFGTEVVPRVSLAFYARQPSSSGAVGETKLMFNIGKGIKAPGTFDAQSSLFQLLSGAPGGDTLIDQFGIEPINAERTRTLDIGIEQGFWDGRVRARVSYFNNRNEDLIEFVSKSALPRLGIPQEVANASGFGATVNSASFDAQGVELSGDVAFGNSVRVSGWYTSLDAEVTESFSSSALGPSINPAFPNIPIGQFSPLVGARPFRRPTHTGGLTVSYVQGPAVVSMTSSFVGRQDGSTFLSDGFFGTSLLLPNKNLSGNFQKVDLSGSYQLHPRVKWYASVENLLNQEYRSAGGFPGLPINVRTGARFTLGGDPN